MLDAVLRNLPAGLLALASIILSSIPARAGDAPIRIGVIGPVTGKSSEDMGESIIGGARVFLSEINQIGGVLGRRVELIERDNQANPELGVRIAKDLIENEKVVAAVGFSNTGVALPSAKLFQEAKVPLIISGATGAGIVREFMPPRYPAGYIFRTSASDALQPVVILNDVIDRRGLGKIALLHDDTPYGEFGKQGILAELARRGLAPVLVESLRVGEQDMGARLERARLERARLAGANAIVLYCLAKEAAMVAKSADRMKLKLPIVGPWTLSQRSFVELAGGSAEGARTAVTYVESELSSVSNSFSLAYRKINRVGRIPSAVAAAQTYDALRLLVLAMYQANSTDPDKVREALEDLRQPTISTVVSRYAKPFSPTDHEAITLNMIVMGEIRNGKVIYAYTEDANRGLIARTKKQ